MGHAGGAGHIRFVAMQGGIVMPPRVGRCIYVDINIFFNAHGVTSRGATVIRPKHSMCAACYVYVVTNTGSTFTGLVMKTGKDRLGPSAPRKWSQSC